MNLNDKDRNKRLFRLKERKLGRKNFREFVAKNQKTALSLSTEPRLFRRINSTELSFPSCREPWNFSNTRSSSTEQNARGIRGNGSFFLRRGRDWRAYFRRYRSLMRRRA